MYKVKQVADMTGLSVRALHHYDEIGLLKPKIAPNSYRIYSDDDISTLQQILFFKELDISLLEIKKIINHPAFDKTDALEKHRNLLLVKKKRIEKILLTLDQTIESIQGGTTMSKKVMFESFNMDEIEEHKKKYAKETEKKYGSTDAYKESARRTKNYSEEDWKRVQAETNAAYQLFLDAMSDGPDSHLAMTACEAHRKSITDNFYNCTLEIYSGLADMYIADERFTKNINKNGEGLAEFMSEAMKIYCSKNNS